MSNSPSPSNLLRSDSAVLHPIAGFTVIKANGSCNPKAARFAAAMLSTAATQSPIIPLHFCLY